MKILLSNDDGIEAKGIWALASALSKDHEIIIAAPKTQQSGMSHALSIHKHVEFKAVTVERIIELAQKHDLKLHNPIDAWELDGTPTDCVKIYLEAMNTSTKPDAVISGINHGANLATDVTYSGTVGAALEGYLHDISALAVSIDINSEITFEKAASATAKFLKEASRHESVFFHNINFPKKFKDNEAEFIWTRLGKRDYINAFKLLSDEGKTYYRIGGEVYDIDRSEGTDIYAVECGYVSVTPLHADMTNFKKII
mgnify:CR=1 FL=1